MEGAQIRKVFLDFFRDRGHEIVPSAPMVVRNDPTLMFTNAGMNQFKDFFLGHAVPVHRRVADTQKCLRVSGKHNDLEEVGVDTYHHTMFEMLGNWSFGDYFKEEAITWAWELLTNVYGVPEERLYVTVFGGDAGDGLPFDEVSSACWKKNVDGSRILKFGKQDNFWEMGDTGPCGPCTEVHIDLRTNAERADVAGHSLVNTGHPLVIEIWNLVFIEFNRKADGALEPLPMKHVDTGMGFERLCMVLQGKKSNYDTDVFRPLIDRIAGGCGIRYGAGEKTDVAMRVLADHVRAVAFAIADGQLPSNVKAGYVIRRILRRAVRYGYTFLSFHEPVLHTLVPVLAGQFRGVFPEIEAQRELIEKVIREEEASFLRTLEHGIARFNAYTAPEISGEFAFELYDTYGFPVDLTQLMAREQGRTVDMKGFEKCLAAQKDRSRAAAAVQTGDWVQVHPDQATEFRGYGELTCTAHLVRYRQVKVKGKTMYQLVLDRTPFYAESGGQVGDTGLLVHGDDRVEVTDTRRENDLIVHVTAALPADPEAEMEARVDRQRRQDIMANHSATHLMHAALRQVLGEHVTQKGSLVNEHVTRFDFSHFAKVTGEEIRRIEELVNARIREDIPLHERRDVPIDEAMQQGAMALFGEKYGDRVRTIAFDEAFSLELCGGTHVASTGRIGLFKIVSESAVAAGIRRVEACTGRGALAYVDEQLGRLHETAELLGHPADPVRAVGQLLAENQQLRKENRQALLQRAGALKQDVVQRLETRDGVRMFAGKVSLDSAEAIKSLSFELLKEVDDLVLLLAAEVNGKPHLSLILSEKLVKEKNLDARKLIRELAREIKGGGGGQPFYATAGGKDAGGLDRAVDRFKTLVGEKAG